MANILQNSDDLDALVRIFLATFVVLGLLPHFYKRLSKIVDYFSRLNRPDMSGMDESLSVQENSLTASSPLTDIEHLVFTRLAQGSRKGMTPAAVAKSLYMDRSLIRKALHSLRQKGLIHIVPDWKMVPRVRLSERGRALAMQNGLIPKLTHHPL